LGNPNASAATPDEAIAPIEPDRDIVLVIGDRRLRVFCRLRERPGRGAVPVVVLTTCDLTPERRRRGANEVLNEASISLCDLTKKQRAIAPTLRERIVPPAA